MRTVAGGIDRVGAASTIRKLHSEGFDAETLAERYGCTSALIRHIIAGRRKYGQRRPARQRCEKARRDPSVPSWAHEVAEDYRDHRALFGDHDAARHCRRLLAEARA